MTAGGKCYGCGEVTGRHDRETQRWACEACFPAPILVDPRIFLRGDGRLDVYQRFALDDTPPRLAGETRQAWRRRCREEAKR